MEELADIAGRLMPEIPGDIIDPNPKNATEEPKKKLPKGEQKKNLEEEQEDQSNHLNKIKKLSHRLSFFHCFHYLFI